MSEQKKAGRTVMLSFPDKTYMDLLIKIRHENLNWKRFFRILVKGFLEDDPGIMAYIDDEMCNIRAKSRTKVLKKERQKTEENIRVFGLDEKDIEDIYDILEEEVEP